MNTTEKGNRLEEKVYNLLESLILKDEFLVNSKFSKVFRQRSYYSKDRESDIKMDVTVEVRLPKSTNYSMLYVFECKNYDKTVSIDNIEEFAGKLSQIAGYNVKGTIVTTSRFSESGINYARNKGIALARILGDDFEYDVFRKLPASNIDIKRIVIKSLCEDNIQTGFYSIIDEIHTCNIYDLFINLGLIKENDYKSKNSVPYISDSEIQNIVDNYLCEYYPNSLKVIQPTPLLDICNSMREKIDLKFLFDEELGCNSGTDVLGKINFKSNTIWISSIIDRKLPRWSFTLAHELGHYLIHYQVLNKNTFIKIDTQQSLGVMMDSDEINRMEIQANKFASYLLMPQVAFDALVKQRFLYDGIKNERLYYDNQHCNVTAFYRIINDLVKYFKVSRQAAQYRLESSCYLETNNQPQRIKVLF